MDFEHYDRCQRCLISQIRKPFCDEIDRRLDVKNAHLKLMAVIQLYDLSARLEVTIEEHLNTERGSDTSFRSALVHQYHTLTYAHCSCAVAGSYSSITLLVIGMHLQIRF